MLKTIENIKQEKTFIDLQLKINEIEKKRRDYLDANCEGDRVTRRAAILGVYNSDIESLWREYMSKLQNSLNKIELEKDDVELFKKTAQSSNKRIHGDFITKEIKSYRLDKILLSKIPQKTMMRELENLVDKYIPIYTMQNTYGICTGRLKGKSRNIYSNLTFIVSFYKLDVTMGRVLDSLTKLDISNKRKVLELIEIDRLVDSSTDNFVKIKQNEFKKMTENIADYIKKKEISDKLNVEIREYAQKLYQEEYAKRNIPMLSDKRTINSMVV